MTRYTGNNTTRYRKGGKRMGYKRYKRKSKGGMQSINGHQMFVMQSGKDKSTCCACRQRIEKGANISPYEPEGQAWAYSPDKVWLHSNCVATLMDNSEAFNAPQEPTQETSEQDEGNETVTNTAKVREPIDVNAASVAMVVKSIAGVGDALVPAFWADVTLSEYQVNAILTLLNTEHNVQIIAGPGCGKSFFIQFFSWVGKVTGVYVVFNAAMRDEMSDSGKLSPNVGIYTLHGLGNNTIRQHLPKGTKVQLRKDKLRKILWDVFPSQRYDPKDVKAAQRAKQRLAAKLVPLYKSQLKYTAQDGHAIMRRFHISTNGASAYVNEVLNAIPTILDRCRAQGRQGIIDFDDMIWLPIVEGWTPQERTWVFVDESQDLSPAQLQLALLTAGSNGRTVMVGDPKQAIYAWRGAALNGMDDAYDVLRQHKRGCKRLNLLLTYRCPKAHVALCNTLYPQAKDEDKLKAPDSAIDGVFCRVSAKTDWLSKMDYSRLITVCRTNAPLIGAALACLKRGQKAVIRGRDFSTQLISFVRHINPYGNESCSTFLGAMDLYIQLETRKAEERDDTLSPMVQDQADCIRVLADGVDTVKGIIDRINAIFDDETTDAVIFSTIHQAKGLESDYIAILSPSLMPGPWAKEPHEIEEERHIMWVAWSRAKYALIFVDGMPYGGLPAGYDWTPLDEAIANDPLAPVSQGEDPQEPQKVEEVTKVAKVENEPQGASLGAQEPTTPKVSTFRLSTTLDTRGGQARDVGKNGVDCCKVTDKDGRNIGGAKRTNRTPGWRDRIISKLNEVSGLNVPTFGDKRGKGAVEVTRNDWDAIAEAINAQPNATAYYHVPKGWKMTALIVEVSDEVYTSSANLLTS